MKRILIFVFCFAFVLCTKATDNPRNFTKVKHDIDTITLGMYVTALYDFNTYEKSFCIDFWTWAKYRSEKIFPFEYAFEFPHNKNLRLCQFYTNPTINEGEFVYSGNIKAEILKDWDLKYYPFDKQILRVQMESAIFDTIKTKIIFDSLASGIFPDRNLGEFSIDNFHFRMEDIIYNTGFGDRFTEENQPMNQTYPALILEVELQRNHSWLKFFKLLTAVFLAFIGALTSLKLHSYAMGSRFSLSIGALFACVANKYVVESISSSTVTHSLIDLIHNISLLFILLTIIIAAISVRYYHTPNPEKHLIAKRIDNISFWTMGIVYFGIVTMLVAFA